MATWRRSSASDSRRSAAVPFATWMSLASPPWWKRSNGYARHTESGSHPLVACSAWVLLGRHAIPDDDPRFDVGRILPDPRATTGIRRSGRRGVLGGGIRRRPPRPGRPVRRWAALRPLVARG